MTMSTNNCEGMTSYFSNSYMGAEMHHGHYPGNGVTDLDAQQMHQYNQTPNHQGNMPYPRFPPYDRMPYYNGQGMDQHGVYSRPDSPSSQVGSMTPGQTNGGQMVVAPPQQQSQQQQQPPPQQQQQQQQQPQGPQQTQNGPHQPQQQHHGQPPTHQHQQPVVYASCKLQAAVGHLGGMVAEGGSPPLVDPMGAHHMNSQLSLSHHMQHQQAQVQLNY